MSEVAPVNDTLLLQRKSPPALSPAVAEANHRIANNLQLIVSLIQRQSSRLTLSGRSMTASETKVFLAAVASQVATVARLHRLLSEVGDSAMVDFPHYLREICDMLRDSVAISDIVRFRSPAETPCGLSTEKVLPLALIAVEAVTNAIKYAHPSGLPVTVEVACLSGKDLLVLEVSDDGVGFPEDFDPEVNGGVGIQTMSLLARSVGAALSFDSTALGLTCRVELRL